jgi:hypothetical protein
MRMSLRVARKPHIKKSAVITVMAFLFSYPSAGWTETVLST